MTTTSWFSTEQRSKATALWLGLVAILILAMVVVGGATRVTGSGLSITRWNLVNGALPPLSHGDWARKFALYRQTSQYRLVNEGMSLAQFQWIFWWEWTHRLLGRLLGFIFFVPFVILLATRRMPRRLIISCIALFALGGLQGLAGWRMVQSGLEGRASVAPEWLALHQGTALLLLGAIIWTALESWSGPAAPTAGARRGWRWTTGLFLAAVYIQCLLGALVAGNHAGLVDADWPLMGGRVFPSDYWQGTPWATFAHGLAAVQFNHRMWAYGLFVAGVAIAIAALGPGDRMLRSLALAIAAVLFVQIGLGVANLLLTVPLSLAMAHQFTAVVLLALATILHWRARRMA